MNPDFKTCRQCKQSLPISEYYRNRDTADGFLTRCKQCFNEYQKQHKFADDKKQQKRERRRVGERIPEWLLVRKTGSLGDLVEQVDFAKMAGVTVSTVKFWRSSGGAYGLDTPTPVFVPEVGKPVWLRSEVEEFVRRYKAIRAANPTDPRRSSINKYAPKNRRGRHG